MNNERKLQTPKNFTDTSWIFGKQKQDLDQQNLVVANIISIHCAEAPTRQLIAQRYNQLARVRAVLGHCQQGCCAGFCLHRTTVRLSWMPPINYGYNRHLEPNSHRAHLYLMKTLFLLRHAKSSWADPDLKDFERPLSTRGAKDVPLMAERFLKRHAKVDCIICSPATRTKTTANLFARQINYPVDDIVSNPELYFAGAPMFLKATRLVDDDFDSAMLIGHNPAITEFVNEMANAEINNIPTCGLVELSLPIENWADAKMGGASLVHYDYPKKIMK